METNTEHAKKATHLTTRLRELYEGQAALNAQLEHTASERDTLKIELEHTESERDTLKIELEHVRLEYKAAQLEVDTLMARLSELSLQLAKAEGKDQQLFLSAEIKRLHQALKNHASDLYGTSKGEKRKHTEPEEMSDEDAERRLDEEAEIHHKRAKKRKSGTKRQPTLPLRTVHHYLDEADQDCPGCGTHMKLMGGAADVTEQITAVVRRYFLERHVQHKYRCNRCHHIDTALGSETRLTKGGRYDVAFAANVAIDKYLDHLPLERQVRRMARAGLTVTSTTLWDQLLVLYQLLLPTLIQLGDRVRTADLLHADETSWRMMGKGPSKKWWLWVISGVQGALFELLPSRGKDSARQILKGYDKTLVADAYGVYTALEKAETQLPLDANTVAPNFTLGGCWAHARRPFIKAEKHGVDVKEGLDLIEALFHIERLAAARAGDDLEALLHHRRQLREERSRDIIEKLKTWRDKQVTLPKSDHAKGLTYLTNQWERLTLFLSNPLVPIDNNAAERRLRGPVVSRKNYQGVRSVQGANVAAMFFSFFATCEIVGVDPRDWLLAAVKAAKESPERVLLPHDFAEAQQTDPANDG